MVTDGHARNPVSANFDAMVSAMVALAADGDNGIDDDDGEEAGVRCLLFNLNRRTSACMKSCTSQQSLSTRSKTTTSFGLTV